jgi:hypothetical protein
VLLLLLIRSLILPASVDCDFWMEMAKWDLGDGWMETDVARLQWNY